MTSRLIKQLVLLSLCMAAVRGGPTVCSSCLDALEELQLQGKGRAGIVAMCKEKRGISTAADCSDAPFATLTIEGFWKHNCCIAVDNENEAALESAVETMLGDSMPRVQACTVLGAGDGKCGECPAQVAPVIKRAMDNHVASFKAMLCLLAFSRVPPPFPKHSPIPNRCLFYVFVSCICPQIITPIKQYVPNISRAKTMPTSTKKTSLDQFLFNANVLFRFFSIYCPKKRQVSGFRGSNDHVAPPRARAPDSPAARQRCGQRVDRSWGRAAAQPAGDRACEFENERPQWLSYSWLSASTSLPLSAGIGVALRRTKTSLE